MNCVPAIVKRAMLSPVTHIGQLSKDDVRVLDLYVKRGVLCKGVGGGYATLKAMWALAGFNFAADRAELMAKMMTLVKLDAVRLSRKPRQLSFLES